MKSPLLSIAAAGTLIGTIGVGYAILTTQEPSPPSPQQVEANEAAPTGASARLPGPGEASRGHEISELRRDLTLLSNEVAVLKTQVRELGGKVAMLPTKGELAALEAGSGRLQPSAWDPPSGTSNDGRSDYGSGTEEGTEALLAREEQSRRRRISAIEAVFRSQRIDRKWAGQAAQTVWNAMQFVPTETQIFDVKCRFTMCRLEVQHGSEDARGQFEGQFLALVGDAFPRMTMDYTEYEDGSTEATIYLVRSGYDLPDVNPL